MAQAIQAQAQTPPGTKRTLTERVGDAFESFWKDPAELRTQQQPQQRQQPQTQGELTNNEPENKLQSTDKNGNPIVENPMDVYAGLWDNEPPKDKDGKPIQATEAPKFQLDPKVVKDAASRINMMEGLPPELAEKMQNGQMQPADYQALAQHTGQRAYEHAIQHATALTDRFISQRLEHETQGLNGKFTKLLAKSKVVGHEAIKNNPALAEHFNEVTERLHSKHPEKDPDWIADQATKYFTDIAKGLGYVHKDDVQEQSSGGRLQTDPQGNTRRSDGKIFDFDAYLKEPTQ